MKTSMCSENFTSVEKDDLIIYTCVEKYRNILENNRTVVILVNLHQKSEFWEQIVIEVNNEFPTRRNATQLRAQQKRTLLIFVTMNSWLETEHQCLFWPKLMSELWTLFRNNAILCQAIRTCNFEEQTFFLFNEKRTNLAREQDLQLKYFVFKYYRKVFSARIWVHVLKAGYIELFFHEGLSQGYPRALII